jgi:hypothetical protein
MELAYVYSLQYCQKHLGYMVVYNCKKNNLLCLCCLVFRDITICVILVDFSDFSSIAQNIDHYLQTH